MENGRDKAAAYRTEGRLLLMEGIGGGVVAVVAATRASESIVEALATLTHPTNSAGGYTRHKGIVLNIMSDHSTGGNERTASNGMTTDNAAIGT